MFASALAVFLVAAPPPTSSSPAPAPPPTAAPQATLAFAIEGVRSSKGELLIAVYTSKVGWLDVPRAAKVLKLPATPGTLYAVMEGLPVGDCAVAVFHDENGNGKLDMRWFPLPGPSEGTAASNGATGTMGPPSFQDARIDCRPGETVVRMKLAY